MAITSIYGCSQDDFGAKVDGSCEGIAFYYCMNALNHGLLSGLLELTERKAVVSQKVERIMAFQDQICGDLMNSGTYESGSNGKPVFDPGISVLGVRNQGRAIQEFHNLYSREARTLGCKSIGTLSSFFEGGFVQLLQQTIDILVRSRRGSALIAMQIEPLGHSVALAYDGTDLYFFDPNSGVHEVTIASAAVELAADLKATYGIPFCVHVNMFKSSH